MKPVNSTNINEIIRYSVEIKYAWAITSIDVLYFVINGRDCHIRKARLKQIFFNDKFADVRKAFIANIKNPAKLVNDEFSNFKLNEFPKELRLKAKMSTFVDETI